MRPHTLLVFPNVRALMPYVFPIDLGQLSAWLSGHGFHSTLHLVDDMRSLRRFDRVLREKRPDVVGFTGVYSQAPYISRMAAAVKAWRPDVPVLVGGKHATLVPEEFAHDPNIDVICVGEGEHALLEYLQALAAGERPAGIPNLWLRQEDGSFEQNACRAFIADLDTLPLPDYEAVDYQKILDSMFGTAYMVAGRGGCPCECRFCGVPAQADKGIGEYVRLKSVDYLLDEIAWLKSRYSFDHIYFRDDTFTWNREWALEFAEKFPHRFDLTYEFLTRADYLDDELIEAFTGAGCECIWFGADSGNDHIREDVLGKTVPNDRLIHVCDQLHRAGIRPLLTNMVGLPHERPSDFEDTVDLNRRIYRSGPSVSRTFGASPAVFTFNPFPGTPLFDECKQRGWLRTMRTGHWAYTDSYVEMPQFSQREVARRMRTFRYRVHRDSAPVWAWWCRIKDSTVRRVMPDLGPLEFVVRNVEHRALHGRWLPVGSLTSRWFLSRLAARRSYRS